MVSLVRVVLYTIGDAPKAQCVRIGSGISTKKKGSLTCWTSRVEKTSRKEIEQSELKIHQPARQVRRRESKQGQTVDALALGGDEGRDKLRKAPGRCK